MIIRKGWEHGGASGIRTATVDGSVELLYETVAHDGAPSQDPPLSIVLLHGALAGRRTFSRQHQALSSIGRLIIPSSRGHDGSELTLSADYGIETSEIRDLSAVLDAEGIERLHLIGHSSGGATAFAFAQAYPDRIERLVLMEPTFFTLLSARDLDTAPQAGATIIEAAETASMLDTLRAFLEAAMGQTWHELDDNAQLAEIAKIEKMGPFIVPHLRALRNFAVTPADLKALRPPTLLFYARNSFDFEAKIAAQWQAHRPDLECILVEGAGHNLHRDQSGLVNGAICGFLNS